MKGGASRVAEKPEVAEEAPLCGCGCLERVKRYTSNCSREGQKKGEWARFINRHFPRTRRKSALEYEIDGEEGCWLWLGSFSGKYAKGYDPRTQKSEWAHRLYYEFWHGPIPEGLEVDHKCENTKCVNPEHLEAVTEEENRRRRDERE